jgi:hypothetical protein
MQGHGNAGLGLKVALGVLLPDRPGYTLKWQTGGWYSDWGEGLGLECQAKV